MEFEKYKQLGAYHWEEYEQNTIYGQHAKKVADWVKEKSVLDVGAGDGLITCLLIEKGVDAIGIDDNKLAVELAKEKKVPVRVMSAYDLKFGDDVFDAVLMADVIEHLEYPPKSISEIRNVLKPKGILYITTPPRKESGGLHDKYHFREYSPQELIEFIEPLGFELVEPTEIKFVRIYAKFRKK